MIDNLNLTSPMKESEIDAYQIPGGPLILGLDNNGKPVERDGGIVGSFMIVGNSPHKGRLENAIIRGIQTTRPTWDPPYSVSYMNQDEFDRFIQNRGQSKKIVTDATQAVFKSRETGNALRFFGHQALKRQLNLALETMEENRDFMRQHDLFQIPDEMVYTLHISHLDRLRPQNDTDGIYKKLADLIEADCTEYGVNLIIGIDDSTRITKRLKDKLIILSLALDSQAISFAITGFKGMENASEHVGSIETRRGTFIPFRF